MESDLSLQSPDQGTCEQAPGQDGKKIGRTRNWRIKRAWFMQSNVTTFCKTIFFLYMHYLQWWVNIVMNIKKTVSKIHQLASVTLQHLKLYPIGFSFSTLFINCRHNPVKSNNSVQWIYLVGIIKSVYEPSGTSSRSLSCFCSMKRLGVFLLPPGWDASPSQGYPQH